MTATTLLTTAAALGTVYALVGLAVVAVSRVTRTLHLAVGPVLAVAALAEVTLVAVGAPTPVALGGAAVVAVAASIALEPLVLRPLGDPTDRLVGLVVAGAVLEVAATRLVGARTLAPPTLVGDDPLVAAVVLGAPLALVVAVALGATRWGRQVDLVGGSEDAAARVGVSPGAVRLGTLAVSGVVVAAAAALVAPIAPIAASGTLPLTLRGVAAAVLLGRLDAGRAVLGGLLVGTVEAVALAVLPGRAVELGVAAVVIALAVAIRPGHRRGWARAW